MSALDLGLFLAGVVEFSGLLCGSESFVFLLAQSQFSPLQCHPNTQPGRSTIGHLLQEKLLFQSAKASSIYNKEQHLITFARSTNYQQATVTVQLKTRGLRRERNKGQRSLDTHIASGTVHHRQTVLEEGGKEKPLIRLEEWETNLSMGKQQPNRLGRGQVAFRMAATNSHSRYRLVPH